MKTNKYKYVVSIQNDVHAINEDREWEEPIASNSDQYEFTGNNLLEERNKALQKAIYFENFFSEQKDFTIYPTRKWNTIEDDDKNFVMIYQIQVFLKGNNEDEDLCIYDDSDGINNQSDNIRVFEDLLKEYEIFERLGVDTKQYEELVVFKDWNEIFFEWKKRVETEGKILSNGMNWTNPDFLRNLTAEDLKLLDEDDENVVKKMTAKKSNKKTEYKTTSIHRIKVNTDNIEISIKTTSEIPKEIQNELIALIDKWKNL